MARNFEVLVESAYLPYSEGEEVLNGQPTGSHRWAREAYFAGEVVSEDDLAPDYVELYDKKEGGVRQQIRQTDAEPTRTRRPRSTGGNVTVSSDIVPSQSAVEGEENATTPQPLPPTQPVVQTETTTPQSAVQGEGPPANYSSLRADEIKAQASGWELPQLRGALQVELARGIEARNTVILRLQEEIDRKEAT